jgi:tetratricopeptide (TPR) repeat protein
VSEEGDCVARPPGSARRPGPRTWRLWAAALVATLLAVAGARATWAIATRLAVRKHATVARRLMAEGKFSDAAEPLQRWLQAQPDSPEGNFLLARALLQLQSYDKGFPLLARALALGYRPESVALERGQVLVRLGRHHEAIPYLYPLVFGPSARPDPAADQVLAQCYLETFELGAAAKAIERWIRDAPRDAKPYLWKAQVDRRADAGLNVLTEDYEKALAVDPDCAEARLNLGDLYLQAHRVSEAEACYSAHVDRFPNDPAGHLGMGKALSERGDLAAAADHFDRAVALDPRNGRPLLERARIEYRTGRLDRALALLDRARALESQNIALETEEIEVHYLRSLVLARLSRKDEAQAEQELVTRLRRDQKELAALLEALQVAPRDVNHQYNAARWLFEHGHPEEGMRWAEKILRENPSHPETNLLLADHYQMKGDVGLANYYRHQASAGRP